MINFKNLFKKNYFFWLVLLFPLSFIIGNAAINFYLLLILLSSFFLRNFFFEFVVNNKVFLFTIFLSIIYLVVHTIIFKDDNIIFYKTYLYQNEFKKYVSDKFLLNIKTSISIIKLFLIFIIFQLIFNKLKIKQLINIITIWKIFFLFLCFDVIFQFLFGFNIVGIEPQFHFSECQSYSIKYLFVNNINKTQNCIPFLETWRLSSFFGEEKVVGSFLVHFLPIFFLIIDLKKFKDFLIIIFYGFAIFITGERMAFILYLFCIFIYILLNLINGKYNYKLSIKKVIFLTFLFFFSFYFIQNNPKIKERYNEINILVNAAKNNERVNLPYISLWDRAIDVFFKKKLMGNGANYFRDCSYKTTDDNKFITLVYPEIRDKYGNHSCATHPHNFYLQIISEYGLIGLLFFLLNFIYILTLIFKKIKKNINSNFFACSIVMIAFLFFPFKVTGNIFSTFYGSMFFFIYSLSYYLIKTKKIK